MFISNMKKFALIPAVALMLLASCSDSEEVRPIPNDPVATVPAVADVVNLTVPNQESEYTQLAELGSNYYQFKYANGQELVIQIDSSTTSSMVALVKKIGGNVTNAVIPPALEARVGTETVQIPVVSLDLYENAVSETVKKITIPATVNQMLDGNKTKFIAVDNAYLRKQVEKCPNVEDFEIEQGFVGTGGKEYCSLDGAIYTADFSTLVAVPLAKTGTYTIADGVKRVDDRAFYKCGKIDCITFPASVEEIGEEAVVLTDYLLAINMMPTQSPKAGLNAFGYYAHNGVLRIPAGSRASYIVEKPNLQKPVEPTMPDMETGTDEEWDAYDDAYKVYSQAKKDYDAAMAGYYDREGYTMFKNIQEVTFK